MQEDVNQLVMLYGQSNHMYQ